MATDIEQIEHRRPANPDMDALYFLSPQPHIVDCLMADLERQRYRKGFLLWTTCWATPFPWNFQVQDSHGYLQFPILNSAAGWTGRRWFATISRVSVS